MNKITENISEMSMYFALMLQEGKIKFPEEDAVSVRDKFKENVAIWAGNFERLYDGKAPYPDAIEIFLLHCLKEKGWIEETDAEPYMGHVGPITEMTMDLKFDRPIVKEKHYISPGGYAFRSGGKTYHFDFLCFEGRIDPEDPTILHAEVHHLDKDYSYDMSDFNAENLQEIEEFFVYTGEYDDPEIYLESVLSLTIWQGDAEMDIKKELLPVKKSSENIERQMQKQIQKVGQLEKQLPDGGIMDADTILVDLLEECDFHMSGFAQDIFNIYRNSSDKEAVKQMFYEFTDMEFEDYLKLCLKELDCE